MPAEANSLKVYFLDVGQGDCTFVVPPEGEGDPVLFDCADLYTAERFVANHEIRNLQAVVASHLDIDHVRGMLPFMKQHFEAERRIQRLVLGLDRIPRERSDKNLQALIEAALRWERDPPHEGFTLEPTHRTASPLVLGEGDGWRVELVLPWYGTVLSELAGRGQDPNSCSAVLRIERGGTAILVGGDATLGSWERLDPGSREARVIRVPHHGGEIREDAHEWTEFHHLYEAVAAENSAVSVGTGNGHEHPLEQHLEAARRNGACRLLCTQLTPRCHDNPIELRESALEHAGRVEWPYRHRAEVGHATRRPSKEVPCAGSMVAWLEPDGELGFEPRQEGAHSQFLMRVAHPMCQPQR